MMEAAEAAQKASEHVADGHDEDIGAAIMHHITDGNTLDLGFTEVHLPQWHIGGLDLSITRHVVMMWVCAVVLIALFTLAFRRKQLVPSGISNLLELMVVFVRDELCIKYMGEKHGRRLTPYMLTVFFFILWSQSAGVDSVWGHRHGQRECTAAMAIISFLMIQGEGIRENGFFKHWKNLVPHGLPFFVLPILIPVEILSMLIKPFALCIRLFANMTAGHVAILGFLGLIFIFKMALVGVVAVPLAVALTVLELFVAFLQAFIFSMLTSLFIGFSIHPAH